MSTKRSTGKKTKTKRTEIIVKEREDNWYIPPSQGIPKYQSEFDPHCPTAKLRKFNEDKRIKAKELARQDKVTNQWVQSSLQPNIEDIGRNHHRRNKNTTTAVGSGLNAAATVTKNRNAYAEIEILQKIIVRENLLSELHRLLKTQNDITSCIAEVVELIKALRFQTLDIIEDINAWQQVQRTSKAFMFKGFNYLVKIKCDLDFLDFYEEINEKFNFNFKSNPLAYRGGGNIITGYDSDMKQYEKGLMNSYYNTIDTDFLDGIEISRLHHAEKIIQNEFNRLAKEKDANNQMATENDLDDILNRDIFNAMSKSLSSFEAKEGTGFSPEKEQELDHEQQLNNSNEVNKQNATKKITRQKKKTVTRSSSTSGVPTKKTTFNPRKIKQERIATLSEEASELKAMMVHVEEQMATLWEKHNALVDKRELMDKRMKEAKALGREVAAQHIQAEISVNIAELQENQAKIKDLQRENYFIGSERKRKLGVMQKLKNEIDESKRKAQLQKKIEIMIKKHGLSAALELFHGDVNSVSEINEIGEKTGARMEWHSSSCDGAAETDEETANDLKMNAATEQEKDGKGQELDAEHQHTMYDSNEEDDDDDLHIARRYETGASVKDDGELESMVTEMRLLEDSDELPGNGAYAISPSLPNDAITGAEVEDDDDDQDDHEVGNSDEESNNEEGSEDEGDENEEENDNDNNSSTANLDISPGADLLSEIVDYTKEVDQINSGLDVVEQNDESKESNTSQFTVCDGGDGETVKKVDPVDGNSLETDAESMKLLLAENDTNSYALDSDHNQSLSNVNECNKQEIDVKNNSPPPRVRFAEDTVEDPLRMSLTSINGGGGIAMSGMNSMLTPNSSASLYSGGAGSDTAVANDSFNGSQSSNLTSTTAIDRVSGASSFSSPGDISRTHPDDITTASEGQHQIISPMTDPGSDTLSPALLRTPPLSESRIKSCDSNSPGAAMSDASPLSMSNEMYVSDDEQGQSTDFETKQTMNSEQNRGDISVAMTEELDYPLDQLPSPVPKKETTEVATEHDIPLDTSPSSRVTGNANAEVDAHEDDIAILDRYMSSTSFADGEYPAGSAVAVAKSSRKVTNDPHETGTADEIANEDSNS